MLKIYFSGVVEIEIENKSTINIIDNNLVMLRRILNKEIIMKRVLKIYLNQIEKIKMCELEEWIIHTENLKILEENQTIMMKVIKYF